MLLLLVFLMYVYAQPANPPKPSEFENVVITLERTVCFGRCPAYKVTLYGDGRVEYEGTRFVQVTGTMATKISQERVKELVTEFNRIDYFSLQDTYDAPVTDLPTTITSITVDGRTKKVENYYGGPKSLTELENKIDETTNSKIWIEGK